MFFEFISKDNIKYGLGLLGVVIVVVIKGILNFYGIEILKLDLFKLSVLV